MTSEVIYKSLLFLYMNEIPSNGFKKKARKDCRTFPEKSGKGSTCGFWLRPRPPTAVLYHNTPRMRSAPDERKVELKESTKNI